MKKSILVLSVCMIPFFISACNGKGSSSALFTVGGVISGLNGTVVLQNNGGDDLTLTANGPFVFPTAAPPGSSYDVTVSTNPQGQTCVVTNGAGTVLISNISNISVHCYERGGLDTTFNAPNGFFSAQTHTVGDDTGNAIAIDSQGRLLVTGKTTTAGNADMIVWRFNDDGTLDTTFNAPNGFLSAQTNTTGYNTGNAIAIDSRDRILVTGSTTSAGYTDMVVWRFNDDGTLDSTFNGGAGLIVYDNGDGDDSGNAVAVDSQGRIVVAGSITNSDGNLDMAVWRFNANGTTDTKFGSNGMFVDDGAAGGTAGDDVGNGIAIDSSGEISVVGSSENSAGEVNMAIWRIKSDGTPDTAFSQDGIATYNGAAGGVSGNDYGNGIAIDLQGRIVVTGSSKNGTDTADTDMVIWRYKTDGGLDNAVFGNKSGIVVNNGAAGSNGDDAGNAIAIDSQGRILVAGSSTNSSGNRDMVVWRFNDNGSIDTTFGADGILTNDSAAGGSGHDSACAVVTDSDGRILLTGSSTNKAGNTDMVIWRVFP